MSHNTLNSVDDQIFTCLNLDKPKSFFLFAGAGSGKTRSLVEVLKRFRNESIQRLKLNGQKVAIITYTNAASNEIKHRLEFDDCFIVSTIHSFSWALIRPYQKNIKEWIRTTTQKDLEELAEQQRKGRMGTKAAIDRAAKIDSKEKRLRNLDKIRSFTYNPNGINIGKDSLNHAEVIKMTSDFLTHEPLMQQILISKYPILLIDESQDTKKELIEAFFLIQSIHCSHFSLGLFGDTMQRIYMDGKPDLGISIPDSWEKPSKNINYRCPNRVITLINRIRSEVDEHFQEPSDKNEEGYVRLFIVDSNLGVDRQVIEKRISEQMADITSDDAWNKPDSEVKTLTLEHHMAARRSGFVDFFTPLYNSSKDSTGLLDGSMAGIPFLIHQLFPLISAKHAGNEFAVAQIMRKFSPLLDKQSLREESNQFEKIEKVNTAVESLLSLWKDGSKPILINILKELKKSNLFLLPNNLAIIVNRSEENIIDSDEFEDDRDKLIDAWDEALNSPYIQLEKYVEYISDKSPFGTHQGVKGLEFPHVRVILDDDEARGFLFSYEKLLGGKELSDRDRQNEGEGKETSLDRTRRLFYVTCSRAEKSLAIVAYSKNPSSVKKYATLEGWFSEDEIIELSDIKQ
jgi:DNA helicase II / ATP-dependent DNA helicase PcrA